MRIYKTGEIRNVAVVGHGASGKTSLVDALAFVAGTSKRHGSIKDGTALTDYTPDEIERKYSINLALAGKAHAFLQGRAYVAPQDIKSIGPDVLRHRVITTFEAEADDVTSEKIVAHILDKVAVP